MPVDYSRRDVGPFDYYCRVTVPASSGEPVYGFVYGLGDKIPGTDRVASLTDTNFPKGRVFFDESMSVGDFSWHIQVPNIDQSHKEPLVIQAVKHLIDQTVLVWHLGGEKPFYQCLMAADASWGTHGVQSSLHVLPHTIPLHRMQHSLNYKAVNDGNLWFFRLDAPVIPIPIDVMLRLGCIRSRGVA